MLHLLEFSIQLAYLLVGEPCICYRNTLLLFLFCVLTRREIVQLTLLSVSVLDIHRSPICVEDLTWILNQYILLLNSDESPDIDLGRGFSLRQMLLAKHVGSGHIKEHGRNILPALPRCIMKTVLNFICFDFHLT